MRSYLPTIILACGFVCLAVGAKATSQPEQQEGYRYDINNSGINLSLFKLFTIQPLKKDNADKIKADKPAPHKADVKKAGEPVLLEKRKSL